MRCEFPNNLVLHISKIFYSRLANLSIIIVTLILTSYQTIQYRYILRFDLILKTPILIIYFHQEPSSSFHGEKGKGNLFAGLNNLFVGGSETTSSTLNWGLFYLAKSPEIQNRAVAEIQTVIGCNRFPSLEDRPNTPLVEAIIMEIHRMCAQTYIGIPREVSKDTTLGKYFIPRVS
jgi:hypothetical protein